MLDKKDKKPAHEVILEMIGEMADVMGDLVYPQEDFKRGSSIELQVTTLLKVLDQMIIPERDRKKALSILRNIIAGCSERVRDLLFNKRTIPSLYEEVKGEPSKAVTPPEAIAQVDPTHATGESPLD